MPTRNRDQANSESGFYGDLNIGSHPALLVIDFQKGFTQPALSRLGGNFDAAVEVTSSIIEVVQDRIPIIFSVCGYRSKSDAGLWIEKCGALEDLMLGTECCELDSRLSTRHNANDLLIYKKMPSVFFGTSLSRTLNSMNVDTLFVTGCTTSGCVRASVVDALQYGFAPFVVQDACADRSIAQHESNLVDMESKYAQIISSGDLTELLSASL